LFTGLAVMNPNATAVSVTVRAWDKDGRATAEKTLQVQAGQRIVDLLNGSRLFGPAFDQVGGHLELSSDQPVVSFVVFGDGGAQFSRRGRPVGTVKAPTDTDRTRSSRRPVRVRPRHPSVTAGHLPLELRAAHLQRARARNPNGLVTDIIARLLRSLRFVARLTATQPQLTHYRNSKFCNFANCDVVF
jgi:hypothetical protein